MKTEKGKTFKLDLSEYKVIVDTVEKVDGVPVLDVNGRPKTFKETVDYPIRGNISTWLRSVGMFKKSEDVAEAVCLAKQVREATEDFVILDEKEATILRTVVDRHLELAADGRVMFGGEIHEEAICRVANMEEIKAE